MLVEKITGVVKDYAWGSPGGIDRVRGLPSSGEIQAEWWLGDHPAGEATLSLDARPLTALLAAHGYESLGFLLKVLTPATPLSLQVHPTTAQAEAGFAAEEQAGIPLDSPSRIFKDRFAKPELVVCVTGVFDALAGNAPDDVVVDNISRLVSAGLDENLAKRWQEGAVSNRQDTVAWLLGGEPDAKALVDALGQVASADPLLSLLWVHYPGDAGCAVAMMLNRVALNPGEALFLEAGQPHAYLSGVAVELMAPSDNVLRGGLTPKHIDVDQLVDIASFDPSPPPRLNPITRGPGWLDYQPGSQAFGLHRLEVAAGGDRVAVDLTLPAVCLSIDAGAVISVDGAVTELAPGEACVVVGTEGQGLVEVLPGSALWIAHKR
jgi:mannose-6-phosphate isomerase